MKVGGSLAQYTNKKNKALTVIIEKSKLQWIFKKELTFINESNW